MRVSSLLITFTLLAMPAAAQDSLLRAPGEAMPGMHHMSVQTPPQTAPATAPAAPADAAPQVPAVPVGLVDKQAVAPPRKILTVDQALVKPGELKAWSQMDEAVVAAGPEAVDKLVRQLEADPGVVPPTGLLFTAKALADQNRMEQAAVYFYVAQLRASFDAARWPPQLSKDEQKRLRAEQRKSPDQRGQIIGGSIPKLTNPHASVALLSSAISEPISKWLFSDPVRAAGVLVKVKDWDASVPYGYLPPYALPQPLPFADWASVLPPTRDAYFTQMNQFIAGLKKLKPEAR